MTTFAACPVSFERNWSHEKCDNLIPVNSRNFCFRLHQKPITIEFFRKILKNLLTVLRIYLEVNKTTTVDSTSPDPISYFSSPSRTAIPIDDKNDK